MMDVAPKPAQIESRGVFCNTTEIKNIKKTTLKLFLESFRFS